MLTNEQIQTNKETLITLVKHLDSNINDIDGLLQFLENSGFYNAPASTKYHCSYRGGLCEHSLNVYNTFMSLVGEFRHCLPPHYNSQGIDDTQSYLLNFAIKVVLLHDVAKVNYYEFYFKNVKDNIDGKWKQVEDIKVKDCTARETYGNANFNNYMVLSRYLALDEEEIIALMNYSCSMEDWYSNKDMCAILGKHPYTIFLHCADMISTYTLERGSEG